MLTEILQAARTLKQNYAADNKKPSWHDYEVFKHILITNGYKDPKSFEQLSDALDL